MRTTSEQSIPLELVRRITNLTALCAELSDYVSQLTALPGRGQEPIADGNLARPIEFLTENGFAIIRSWEIAGCPVPTDGCCCFVVRDPSDIEAKVTVEIARPLITETAGHTRGRIQPSSSFWICCAERHLAAYIAEHDACPGTNQLRVECLDCEEIMLALHWEDSDS